MPLINNGAVLTLQDWAKSLGPDHKVQTRVAQLLAQKNGIVTDAGWIMGNLPIGHQMEVQTGLPDAYYVGLNAFVPVSHDTAMPILEQAAILKAFSDVDQDLYELGGPGEGEKLRARNGKSQIERFNQTYSKTAFYGNTQANPSSFVGLSTRFSSLEAVNGQNILDAGGVNSTNASIWMVVWGEDTSTMFFPQGSKAGIEHMDLGLVTMNSINTAIGASDSSPLVKMVYREKWAWKHGLALPDWRYVVRIANIDVPSLLAKQGADLLDLLIRAYHHLPDPQQGRPAIYMNRTIAEMLDVQKRDAVKEGGQLKYEVVDGVEIPVFRGMPVRIVDQLLNTEARVV